MHDTRTERILELKDAKLLSQGSLHADDPKQKF